MINITRGPDSPTSLDTPEIQQYIADSANYLADPINNPKPVKPPAYRNADLLDAFDNYFYSKCYLTEQAFSNSYGMDVEHFISQDERPDLRFSWENLYPADHDANMSKPRATPAGGYLDCCDPADDVEVEIVYDLPIHSDDISFQVRDPLNVKAVNTVSLLRRVHNGHDAESINKTKTLRHAIYKKHLLILHLIDEWKRAVDGSNEKFRLSAELRGLLSRKSSYTMLVRSLPAVVYNLPVAHFFD